jgi:hypothetical protein
MLIIANANSRFDPFTRGSKNVFDQRRKCSKTVELYRQSEGSETMNVDAGFFEGAWGVEGMLANLSERYWMDGDDEQEDELDDVHKGILDAPTDDEGPGEVDESNKGDAALEKQDEMGGVPMPPPPDPEEEKKEFPGF